ncbi:MAG: glucan endo-1,3-beta-D-glucosidase [Planctomycetota bacterium]|nr:MAG: glucan endo-1,3-beta-D-glucosidase [Planctomycetota bacterium]
MIRPIWISLLSVVAVAGTLRADEGNWKLIWSDEFDGDKLDYSKWEAEVNAFGGGNDEQQMYTDRKENVRVENGSLVIEARKDNPNIQGTTRPYSSGRVRTKHRGDWKYGKIEARAKLPEGEGMWSAVWMLPTEEKYGGWAASGEIDIIEINGKSPETAHLTIHHGGGWPNNRQTGGKHKLDEGKYTDDFHVYAIEWQAKSIRWLIDGKPVYESSDWQSAGGKFPAPFDQEFHLILNLAVGGRFVGRPSEKTVFPSRMLVDYVRVYQQSE